MHLTCDVIHGHKSVDVIIELRALATRGPVGAPGDDHDVLPADEFVVAALASGRCVLLGPLVRLRTLTLKVVATVPVEEAEVIAEAGLL